MRTPPPLTPHILVTSALYYANGPLHLGHILETIQSDIWVRFQKLMGRRCFHICGSDAHGTPIMLQAEKQGITPEALVSQVRIEHQKDFSDFLIDFDNFYTTHSEENRALTYLIYQRLKAKGDICTRTIVQCFDPIKKMFLPDRYVKGDCPECNAPEQYGDSCEACGATYSPTDLKNPRSVVSGAKPEEKASEHYFFKLENYSALLKTWTQQEHLQPQIANKLTEWFEKGLKQWDISRDGPYFGFPIPETENKYFYVWMDAPIGYMASFQNYCNQHNLVFDEYWKPDSPHQLYHFIGKDIVYFHSLFWPAILAGSQFRTPTAIFAHGFLTINGQKMSKSRGTFITARNYLQHLSPESLRYYLAAKSNEGIDDIDLNLSDYLQRVNADLVGKYINIASRCAGFITKYFKGVLCSTLYDPTLFEYCLQEKENIQAYYQKRQYARAMKDIMALADKINHFIDEHKPWELIKHQHTMEKAHAVCSLGINLFRLLTLYLKPVLPALTKQVEQFLQIAPLTYATLEQPLLSHAIQAYHPLLTRIEQKQIDALLKQGKSSMPEAEKIDATPIPTNTTQNTDTISYDTFAQVDLRIAKILHAEAVEGADKLLKLTVDLNEPKPRQIFAGIKAAYPPESLIGKLTVVVANLAPRKMRFGISEGMVLAAGPGGKDLWILEPHQGAQPGMKVK